MTLFQSEDPIIWRSPSALPSLHKSDLVSGLKFLQDEDWLKKVSAYYESHYKYVGRWWELLGLQQVSIGLPPLPYGKETVRSQFHVLIRGPPSTGKSTLVYTIKDVGVNPIELGDVTAAKIVGSIKEGEWVPGEAYKAKDGVLLIPELGETVKSGEHYSEVIYHLIQLMEDQKLIKSLVQPFKEVEKEREKWMNVKFSPDGHIEYECNACLTVATWEMNEINLMEKVTQGFYSRVFEIPMNYTKSQLFEVLDNIWQNISGVSIFPEDINMNNIKTAFEIMYCANKGILSGEPDFAQFSSVVFPPPLSSTLIKQYKEMVTDILKDLNLEDDENMVLPVLIREPLDGFRFACADAVSRRFCGTMDNNGIVTVDERAINTATEYLRILVNRRVELYKKMTKYMKLSAVEPELMVSDEYRLIFGSGKEGITEESFIEICTKRYNVAERTVMRHIDKLLYEKAVKKVKDVSDRRRTRLVSSIYAVENHPLRGLL